MRPHMALGMNVSEHFWQNFDKLLVTFLVLIFGAIGVWLILHRADDAALQWIENLSGQLVSALLALLGAGKLAAAITKKPDDAPEPK